MQPADHERVRLAGAQLAARTAHHLLNTPLTLALGYSDLLAEDPRLPPELRALAEGVSENVQSAAAKLRRLVRIRRLVEQNIGLPSGPVLDLAESAPEARSSMF